MAKALEISRLTGLEPPPRGLVRKSMRLASKGSWGEQAALQETKALLLEDVSEIAEGLCGAANNYMRALQNIEAVLSGLTSAHLSWNADGAVFGRVLKMIAPLIPLHPGLKKDPLVGPLLARAEPLVMDMVVGPGGDRGIRAHLLGKLEILVDGREIRLRDWHYNYAAKAFLYLLLSPKHRIPTDHLFYLLWPRRACNTKNKQRLYTVISAIRRHIGRPELLVKHRDFYQLEDVWTDLGEIENLLRLSDASRDPDQKEEYLNRARELARGDLLPEFPYDKYIDEHRRYYRRIREKLNGMTRP